MSAFGEPRDWQDVERDYPRVRTDKRTKATLDRMAENTAYSRSYILRCAIEALARTGFGDGTNAGMFLPDEWQPEYRYSGLSIVQRPIEYDQPN